MKLPKNLLSPGTYTKPRLFLCETDKSRICQLQTTDTRGSLKFNSYSELSFEVGRVYNDVITGETKINPYFDKIEAIRLIEIEGVGFFELQGPSNTSDGIKDSKSCTAYSLEYTLSQKFLNDFRINMGTSDSLEVLNAAPGGEIAPIVLYDPNNPRLSLLHLVLENIYGWSINYVDPQLYTMRRQFEVDRASVYDFIMNEICEKFNCYAVFDTINNTISFYAESPTCRFTGDGSKTMFIIGDPVKNMPPFSSVETVSIDGYKTTKWKYGVVNDIGLLVLEEAPVAGSIIEVVGVDSTWETNVFVTFENLSQEINVNYDADSIKTVLVITYGDDEDIREANLGLPYLVDLSYFYNVDWMGQELYDAYTAYSARANSYQTEYTNNSKEILKLNDKIAYEKNRLSLEYSLTESVNATTVGTYYTRHQNIDGSYYYTEVSLPSEYKVDVDYYSNITTNVNEEKVKTLSSSLQKYFNSYFNGKVEETNEALKEIAELTDFEFIDDYTVANLSDDLKNAKSHDDRENAIDKFLNQLWIELGSVPLETAYLEDYKKQQEVDVSAGWSKKDHENYGSYYTGVLFIHSIENAIAKRNKVIDNYRKEQNQYQSLNANISDKLALNNNFTPKQIIRLSAFLREDELHIEDIVETDLDDLSSSFKIKQDAMESGRIELKKLAHPQLQFSMTMANIYALPEFEPIVDQFELGNIIKIKLRDMYTETFELVGNGEQTEFSAHVSFDGVKSISFSDSKKIEYKYDPIKGKIIFDTAPKYGTQIEVTLAKYYVKQSRLLQVDINFDDFSDFSCEFGELTALRTQSDIHADLLSQAITAGKSVASNSTYWTKGASSASDINDRIRQGLLDATTKIKAMDGTQGVTIDKYGIKLQKIDPATGAIDPHQTWIVNNMILMSDDGFKTSRSALGEVTVDGQEYYGIIADLVLSGYIEGSVIKGGTIHIGEYIDENGNKCYHFEVDKDGNIKMGGSNIINGYATDGELSDAIEKTTTSFQITAGEIRGEVASVKTDLEGQISETNSKITQTAGEIRSEVSSVKTNLEGQISETNSTISQTADTIRSEVNDKTTDLQGQINTANSTITQTAKEIRSEVSSVQSNLQGQINTTNSTISQTASQIRSEVNSKTTDLQGQINTTNSTITQTAKDIRAEVSSSITSLDGKITTANSKITQNANAIIAEVNRSTDAEGKLSSRITQNADGISAEVSRAKGEEGKLSSRVDVNAGNINLKVSKDGVISSINQSPENITINANRININGAVTFSSFDASTQSKINGIEGKADTAQNTANSANSAASTAQSTANTANNTANTLANNIYYPGTTQINGANIRTGSVTAQAINTTDLFSKNITASGTFTMTGQAFLEPGREEAEAIMKHYVGTEKIASSRISLYDFDSDGALTPMDAMLAMQAYAGDSTLANWSGAKKSNITMKMNMSNPNEFITMSGTNMWGRKVTRTFGANFSSETSLIIDTIYPVGSIYLSYNHTDPSMLFGGTWVRIQDAFLWATNGSGTIGATGGEREHTLTVDELPSHSHGNVYSGMVDKTKNTAWLSSGGDKMAYGQLYTGGGKAHNNMPPYIQISAWRRTA